MYSQKQKQVEKSYVVELNLCKAQLKLMNKNVLEQISDVDKFNLNRAYYTEQFIKTQQRKLDLLIAQTSAYLESTEEDSCKKIGKDIEVFCLQIAEYNKQFIPQSESAWRSLQQYQEVLNMTITVPTNYKPVTNPKAIQKGLQCYANALL